MAIEQTLKYMVSICAHDLFFWRAHDTWAFRFLHYIVSDPFGGDPFLAFDDGAATMKWSLRQHVQMQVSSIKTSIGNSKLISMASQRNFFTTSVHKYKSPGVYLIYSWAEAVYIQIKERTWVLLRVQLREREAQVQGHFDRPARTRSMVPFTIRE
jgi:hypothetical protein